MSSSLSSSTRYVEAMYASHHSWLVNWLRRKLDTHERAADLAHDTFIRLLSTPRQPGSVHEPRAYLTAIAKGLVIDHYRRQELEQAYLQSIALLPEELAPAPELRLQILETLLRIDSALGALPAKAREAFLLSQLDGLTYAEIAVRLELSLATVKRHMLKAFRACLDAA
ncbi:putative RNA polymerase sigma factor FecI [Pigmentiphaga humi]|uniref:Putative RNA polymerase sigma factor FecI n=1 Tax=Pigmentiphaga humi TaxID=2478468 RepID=A0A3P4AXQ4_9BURK|nr:sigma-70 family RNA polymerase sigma factor [Pigmentiphaga humi]VCU68321.1 putative RNA polymerase sigma factor FecI [Pigmentiphaga humi]